MSKGRGTVERIGIQNADVRIGGVLYRSVPIDPMVSYADMIEKDHVAITWVGEKPRIAAVVSDRVLEPGAVAAGTTTVVSSGSEDGGEVASPSSVILVADDSGEASPNSEDKIMVGGGLGIVTSASSNTLMADIDESADLTWTGLHTFSQEPILSALTASRLVATDGSKALSSVADLTSWIAGTTNRVTVSDDADGTVTLSGPQDIHTGASPTFAGLTISGGGRIYFRDTGLSIYSSADGQLDIDADVQLELTAPTVQIVAASKVDLDADAVDFGTNTDNDIFLTFYGATNDGVFAWREDEDYFNYADDVLISSTERLYLRDTAISIYSSVDGQLDIGADGTIVITAPTVRVAASTKFDVNSNAVDFGTGADTDIVLTFDANTTDGVLTWMEDEDYFKFSDDILLSIAERLYLRDTALSVYSSADGQLDIDADTEIELTSPTVQIAASTKFDVNSNSIDFGTDADVDVTLTFYGATTDGVFAWMEDEDRFQFSDDILLSVAERIYFRDTALSIYSSADGQMDVDADTEIEITAPTVQVVAATRMLVEGTLDLDGDLEFQGAQQITSTSDGITIAPATDLTINPGGDDTIFTWAAGKSLGSSDYVSQTTGWAVSYGTSGGHADFRSMYADELHVKAFIADIYMALIGGIVVTKSRARLSRDFVIPADAATGTLYVEDLEGWENTQLFAASDVVRLRYVDTSGGGLIVTDVWGVVTAYSDLAGGEQSYTFTTSDDGGVDGETIYTGAIALDYGQAGSGSRGIWEATVLDAAGAPYSQIASWETNPWTGGNWTTHVRLGNLDGISGIGLEYGLWAGQGTGNTDPYLLLSDSSAELHNVDFTIHDGANTVFKVDYATPYMGIGASVPTSYLGDDGFWVGSDGGTYKAHLGTVSGGALTAGLSWDGSSLRVLGDALIGPGTGFRVRDAVLYLPFDGPSSPADTQLDTSGHLGQRPSTAAGSIFGWPGVFNKAFAAADAGTNLSTNPSFETGTSGWSPATDITLSQSSDYVYSGSYSLKAVKAGSGLYVAANASYTSGQTYILSFYARRSDGAPITSADINHIFIMNTEVGVSYIQDAGNGWYRLVSGEHLSTATGTSNYGIYLEQAGTYYLDAFLLETVPCTPYFDGSCQDCSWSGTAHASTSSRTKTILTYGDVPIPMSGTVSMWVTKPGKTQDGTYRWLVDGGYGSGIILYITDANNLGVYVGAYRTALALNDTNFAPGIPHLVTLTWSQVDSDCHLYIDGELVASGGYGSGPTDDGGGWDIGHYAGNYQFCGWIDDLMLLDYPLTAYEIEQIYLSDAPLQVGSSNHELYLTGEGAGKVIGHAGGLFGYDDSGNEAFAIALENTTWAGVSLNPGDVLIGDVAASKNNLFLDLSAGTLQWRNNTTVHVEITTAGVLTLGDDAGGEYVLVDSTGIEMYGSGTKMAEITSAGVGYFGDQSNEHVKVSGTGVQVYDGATLLATYSASTTLYDTSGADRLVLSTTGIIVGDESSGELVEVNSTEGIRLYGDNKLMAQVTTSGTAFFGNQSYEHLYLTSSALQFKDGASVYGQLTSTAWTLGLATETHVTITSAGITMHDEVNTERVSITSAGGVVVGDTDESYVSIADAAITMYDANGADRLVLSTTGVIVGDQTDQEYVSISSSGMDIYAANIKMVEVSSTGPKVRIGKQSGGSYVQVGGSIIYMIDENADQQMILSSAGIRFGDYLNGEPNTYLQPTKFELYCNLSTVVGRWEADGDLFIGSDVDDPDETYLAVFANADADYNGEAMGAGDLLIGSNSAGYGNVQWDASASQLLFRMGTTDMLVIDSNGISLLGGSGDVNSLKWYTSGVMNAWIRAFEITDDHYLRFATEDPGGTNFSEIDIRATAGSTPTYGSAFILLTSDQGAVTPGWIALGIGTGSDMYVKQVGVNILAGLHIGNLSTTPQDNDLTCDGTIATASGNDWDLETYHAGAPTADGYVKVVIDGAEVRLLADYIG